MPSSATRVRPPVSEALLAEGATQKKANCAGAKKLIDTQRENQKKRKKKGDFAADGDQWEGRAPVRDKDAVHVEEENLHGACKPSCLPRGSCGEEREKREGRGKACHSQEGALAFVVCPSPLACGEGKKKEEEGAQEKKRGKNKNKCQVCSCSTIGSISAKEDG